MERKKYSLFLACLVFFLFFQFISVDVVFATVCEYESNRRSEPYIHPTQFVDKENCFAQCNTLFLEDEQDVVEQCQPSGGADSTCQRAGLRALVTTAKCTSRAGNDVYYPGHTVGIIATQEAKGGAATSPNWTCVLKMNQKFNVAVEDYGIRQGEDFGCIDIEKIAFSSDEKAQNFCLGLCDQFNKSDTSAPCVLPLFIPTLTCGEYRLTPSKSPELNRFVVPSVSKLNKLGLNLSEYVGRIVGIGIGIFGTIALIIFIYAGLLWMTSRGNATNAETARSMMLWAALGVVVILTSYAVVGWLFDVFK